MLRIIFYFLMMILLVSCEQETSYVFPQGDLPEIAVECVLTNELLKHEITVTELSSMINETPKPVDNANIIVFSENIRMPYSYNKSTQSYMPRDSFRAIFNTMYYLQITYAGNEYKAESKSWYVSPVDTIELVKSDIENAFHIKDSYDSAEEAMWEFNIETPNGEKYKLYRYSFDNISSNQIFAPEKQKIYIPIGSLLAWKKYSLTEDYADYLRSLLSETEWNGGYFDVERGETITNLTEGAVGFFGTCSVLKGEFVVKE